MQVLFLKFCALLLGLLSGSDFCFLFALYCDDFGFKLLLLFFEHCLMSFLDDLDVLVMGFTLLSDSML